MKLPRLDLPRYSDTLPVSGRTISFRPYTVKEEKILLMAATSSNPSDKLQAVYQIVSNCSDINVVSDHPADIEWTFLQIRSCSVSSKVEVVYHIDKEECGAIDSTQTECPIDIKTAFDIGAVTVLNIEEMEKYATKAKGGGWVVPLAGDVSLHVIIKPTKSVETAMYELVEAIIEGEDVTPKELFTNEEFNDFIDDLPANATDNLKTFLKATPVTSATINARCHKCQKEFTYTVSGLLGFLV